MSFEWVDSEKTLDDVIDSVLGGSRYAIDTEFHREKTYFPKLALVQIRWGTQTALIDPLAVDPRIPQLHDSQRCFLALQVKHGATLQDLVAPHEKQPKFHSRISVPVFVDLPRVDQ